MVEFARRSNAKPGPYREVDKAQRMFFKARELTGSIPVNPINWQVLYIKDVSNFSHDFLIDERYSSNIFGTSMRYDTFQNFPM